MGGSVVVLGTIFITDIAEFFQLQEFLQYFRLFVPETLIYVVVLFYFQYCVVEQTVSDNVMCVSLIRRSLLDGNCVLCLHFTVPN